MQGRREACQETRHYGNEQREPEHRGVEMHFIEARRSLGREREQRVEAPGSENHPESAAGQSHEHGLDQKMPYQFAAAAPQRRANGQLALPGHAAREQHARNVRTGDQQHQQDRSLQGDERGLQRTDQVVEEQLCFLAPPVVLFELLCQARREAVEISLRLPNAEAGLEPADDRDPGMVAALQLNAVERSRHEHLGLPEQRKAKVRRHHAADHVDATIENEGAAHGRRIGAELPSPESVGEHDCARAAGDVFLSARRSSDRRPLAQDREKASGDACDTDLDRRTASRQRLSLRADAGDGLERAVPFCQVDVVGRGEWITRLTPRRALVEAHQFFRVWRRQWLQHDPAQHAEHRRASSHTERQSEDGGDGESWRTRKGPQGEAHLVHGWECSEGGASSQP